jgi:hypothetical protein
MSVNGGDIYVASFNNNGELNILNEDKQIVDPYELSGEFYFMISDDDFTECIKNQEKLKKAKTIIKTETIREIKTIEKKVPVDDKYKVIKYISVFVLGLITGVLTYKVVKYD